MSLSPLSHLLPDCCTGELRCLHAELGARHSFREATGLLKTFLPCSPPNHANVRNRLHRVAGRIESDETDETDEATAPPAPAMPRRRCKAAVEIVVMIDSAHLRAVPDHPSCHFDVTSSRWSASTRCGRRTKPGSTSSASMSNGGAV